MRQLEKVEGPAYALGAAAFFGASAPAAKLLLNDLRPVLLSALLYLGAAAALFGFRAVSRTSREAVVSRRDLPLIVGIIGFGGMLGPILMLLGLQRLSAVNTSLLLNLEAPFTMLIAVSVMREHLGLREVFAAVVILLGGGLWSVTVILVACHRGRKIVTVTDSLGLESFTIARGRPNVTVTGH
jgi:drug/metabolite transporter (DMT)-like permease